MRGVSSSREQADVGVGRGPGGPPHNLCRCSAVGKVCERRFHIASQSTAVYTKRMKPDRRNFLSGVAGVAMAGPAGATPVPVSSRLRAHFPWIEHETFLNDAGWHPTPRPYVRATHASMEVKVIGP